MQNSWKVAPTDISKIDKEETFCSDNASSISQFQDNPKDEDSNIDEFSEISDSISSVDQNDNKSIISGVDNCRRLEPGVSIMKVS